MGQCSESGHGEGRSPICGNGLLNSPAVVPDLFGRDQLALTTDVIVIFRVPQNFPRGQRGTQQRRSYVSFKQLCICIPMPGLCYTMLLEEKSQKITYQEHCLSATALFTTLRYLLRKPTFKWVNWNIQHQCLPWLLIQFMVYVNPSVSRDVFFCLSTSSC